MVFKRTIVSICLAATLGVATCPPAQARHVTSDPAANIMDALILVQDIAAVVLKVSDLAEFVKRNISNGDLGAVAGSLGLSESTKGVLEAAPATVPAELQNTEFASATNDAEKMRNFVANELLPPSSSEEELTDAEKEERAKKREAVRNAAIADAYATSVAYLSKKANAEQEVVQPSMSSASSAETNHEKQAAANEVGIARLGELIEANVLSAELLKLKAAEAMGSLPYDS